MTRRTQALRATGSEQTELALEGPSAGELPCLLDASDDAELHRVLALLDWDLADASTDDFTHGLHSYPAKFIPQLPARFVAAFSRPDDLVVDPFVGGGTTGVESLRLGRRFVGVDANPVGTLLGSVKTTTLDAPDWEQIRTLHQAIERVADEEPARRATAAIPDIPNIDKWYAPAVVCALASLKAVVLDVTRPAARDLAMAAFANVAARMSYQESETRYVSKPRPIDPGEVFRRFLVELDRMSKHARRLDAHPRGDVRFVLGDARQRESFPLSDGEAGLVVTSPPYPNAYDYHLYHRFRLFWLGVQPADLRRVEIGSHLKHQAEQDPIASYEADMRAVLNNLHLLLADGRYCVLVVGDGIYSGERYPTAERLAAMAAEGGWIALPTISRSLPQTRRSVTSAGRRLQTEEILILRKRSEVASVRLIPPSYERFPYECDLATREAESMSGGQFGDDGLLRIPAEQVQQATNALVRLAFWHGFEVGSDDQPTNQRLVEDVSSGKRKHSTYATHGLHRYKGKFYPQLAKALLNLSDLEADGAQVLDPFGGSGTVMLEAILAGHDAASIDCSPLATAVAQSKVDILRVPAERLTKAVGRLSESWEQSRPGAIDWDQFAPTTHDELESWFAPKVLEKLSRVLRAVRGLDDARMTAFFEVILSDLIREVSHQEPRDLRIRRRKEPLDDAPVLELFTARSEAAVSKVMALHGNLPGVVERLGNARAVLGTSTDAEAFETLTGRPIDVVISSPPYATALPYLDTDRLSLAAVYGCDRKARSDLEARLIGSRETTRSQQRSVESLIEDGLAESLPTSTVTFLQKLLDAARSDATAGFRKQQLPTVLARYFIGIAAVMKQLSPRMAGGAHLWFVLGDSRSDIGGRKWVIPTVDEVQAIAKHAGMELIETLPITVTREDVIHARHTITENAILHFRASPN